MNFREHYTLIKESEDSGNFEYLIHIKLYEPALEKLKAKPGYLSMVKPEKEKLFFITSNALNNYPFDGKRGASSDGRMSIVSDTSEFEREDLPYLDIYVSGVKIDSDVIHDLYTHLRRYRPRLVSTVTYENLLKKGLKGSAKEAWEDILD